MSASAERLKIAASALETRLAQYAEHDDVAADVLERMAPWFEKIKQGEVIPPARDKFRSYFARPENWTLFKYRDLLELAALYSSIIEGHD